MITRAGIIKVLNDPNQDFSIKTKLESGLFNKKQASKMVFELRNEISDEYEIDDYNVLEQVDLATSFVLGVIMHGASAGAGWTAKKGFKFYNENILKKTESLIPEKREVIKKQQDENTKSYIDPKVLKKIIRSKKTLSDQSQSEFTHQWTPVKDFLVEQSKIMSKSQIEGLCS